jgi:hypothetical protein
VALTVLLEVTPTLQLEPEVESQPDQLAKEESEAAVAVRVTGVPPGTVMEQLEPQSMPPPVTVPEPEPAFATVSV